MVAAAEAGVALDRLALVGAPEAAWPTAVAALLDGFDVVVAAFPDQVSGSLARRLAARARNRGAVLVSTGPWEGADLHLRLTASRWVGLAGQGYGRLRARQVTVQVAGRRAGGRPRTLRLWLPGMLPGTTAVGGAVDWVDSALDARVAAG